MTDVVIIGAGMAGIACARLLRAAGVPVRLIDKGRGIGGRVATRRADVSDMRVTFDHGAQYLDQSEDAAEIANLASDATGLWTLRDGTGRIIGVPEMTALPKALAQNLDVTLNTRVLVVKPCGSGWDIETEAGTTSGTHLVITVPAPQLGALIGEAHPVVELAAKAVMRPCMTLMVAVDADTPVPFLTKRNADDILTWISRNDTKPGRDVPFHTWVAQAHPDWSAAHIDADRTETKAQMVDLLCTELGIDPADLRHAGLHGWRYGLVETPIGQPFLREGTLWVGGDWCQGSKIQDAWRTGTGIAHSVLQTLDTPNSRTKGYK